LNGTTIQTNQFSVTEHKRIVDPGTGRGLPGVFFFYEISPLHVEFIEQRLGWVRFLTSISAVVGGVFTFMGMVDKWIYDKSKVSRKSLG
jgi:16S rRNA G527 N7-methylase RsmG